MANIFKTKPFLDQCSGWLWSSSWKLVWEVLWRRLPGCVEQQRGDLEEVPLIQWHASVLRTVLGLLWGHHDRWVGGVKIVTVFMNTGLDLSGWWLQEWEDVVYLCGMWSHTHTHLGVVRVPGPNVNSVWLTFCQWSYTWPAGGQLSLQQQQKHFIHSALAASPSPKPSLALSHTHDSTNLGSK